MSFESLCTEIKCLISKLWKSSLHRDAHFSGMDHDDGNPQGTVKADREAAILDSIEEYSLIRNIRERLRANEAVSVNMGHSVLLAAVITAAIAVLSGAMVFSSDEDGVGFPLDLPQRIESLLWKDRETEVETFAESLVTDENPSEETKTLGTAPDGCPKEEAAPEDQGAAEEVVVENVTENGRSPAVPVGRKPILLVTVQKGDTIHGILKRQFGKADDLLMNAVLELNPEIEDMNWIRVGQIIRIPLDLEAAGKIEKIGKRCKPPLMERMDSSIVDPAKEVQDPEAADYPTI